MSSDRSSNHCNVSLAVPFFMVVNMERSLEFYMQGLGFELKNKWEPRGSIEWCLLQLEEVSLMLQEYRQNAPKEKHGIGVSICFICQDALKIYNEVLSKHIEVPEPFVGNNMWVVHLADPDGYNIYFESATKVPEETTYSEWKSSSGSN